MSDDTKREPGPIEHLDELRDDANASAKERLERTTRIALMLSYDLIDKLRFFEKETLQRPEEEIAGQLERLTAAVEHLRTAYLAFADLEF